MNIVMEPAGAADIAHMSHLVLLCWTFTYCIWTALIPARESSWFEKLKWYWVAEEGWKYRCLLLSFSPLQAAALGALSIVLFPWWAAGINLSCSLPVPLWPFWTVYRLLSNVNVNLAKPRIKTKQQNKYLGQMARWELRSWASCFRCCWGACERQLLLLRETMVSSTLILLMNVEVAATVLGIGFSFPLCLWNFFFHWHAKKCWWLGPSTDG